MDVRSMTLDPIAIGFYLKLAINFESCYMLLRYHRRDVIKRVIPCDLVCTDVTPAKLCHRLLKEQGGRRLRAQLEVCTVARKIFPYLLSRVLKFPRARGTCRPDSVVKVWRMSDE
jgi:hypothetical protein